MSIGQTPAIPQLANCRAGASSTDCAVASAMNLAADPRGLDAGLRVVGPHEHPEGFKVFLTNGTVDENGH